MDKSPESETSIQVSRVHNGLLIVELCQNVKELHPHTR